jgi:hypothetical protein
MQNCIARSSSCYLNEVCKKTNAAFFQSDKLCSSKGKDEDILGEVRRPTKFIWKSMQIATRCNPSYRADEKHCSILLRNTKPTRKEAINKM